MKYGILIQGRASNWIKDIVLEYNSNFPEAEIVFSTWHGENVDNIECKIVQSELPRAPPDAIFVDRQNINYQIVGVQNGLKKMNADIILKTRSDTFVHNENIFDIYNKNCSDEKIMAPDVGTFDFEYRISDFCAVATKKKLDEYWKDIELYDCKYAVAPETYLTKNYIQKIKKDFRPWKEILREYFYIRDFHIDFQIEYEKLSSSGLADEYQRMIYARSINLG
tara:strand:+ start:215 stop:883 length:669 start_codon:yes stop_codon:yes gene_type:complete